jgi:hypothetical protein
MVVAIVVKTPTDTSNSTQIFIDTSTAALVQQVTV